MSTAGNEREFGPEVDLFASARWLEPRDSPFGVRVLDCRVPARSLVTNAGDEHSAQTFQHLRTDDGEHLRASLPADAVVIPCALSYTVDGGVPPGSLFRALSLDAKWDIFAFDDRIAFRRSWDGELVYTAFHRSEEKRVEITTVAVAGRLASDGATFAVSTVDALLRTHGLRQLVPFPLPPKAPADARAAAMLVHAWHGTLGWFAAPGDTTRFTPADPGPLGEQ